MSVRRRQSLSYQFYKLTFQIIFTFNLMINTISLIVINTYACVFRKISIVYVLSTECTKNNVTIYHIMILLNLNFL